VLKKYAKNNQETWNNIIANEGSVQHLDFLTDDEKEVFRTAFELDQAMVVEHAAKRQEFICQGQSVNLFFPSGEDKGFVKDVHILAWKLGLKGLYYYRTNAGVSADKVGTKIKRDALKDFVSDEAEEVSIACEG
jgi:ribonucleoside-diphosphate reductase alpha chain